MIVVIWSSWTFYHISRLRGFVQSLKGSTRCVGLEVFGGRSCLGNPSSDLQRAGLHIRTLFPDANWGQVPAWVIASSVWRSLNELSPETVFVPGYSSCAGVAAAAWAVCMRRRAILMTESNHDDHSRRHSIEWLKRIILPRVFDGVFVGGRRASAYATRLGFNVKKIQTGYNVVGNEYFKSQALRLRSSWDGERHGLPAKYFLFVGRLAPEKNVLEMLRAFSDYRRSGGSWSLVIAGQGPLLQRVQEIINLEGLGRLVCLRGFRDASQIVVEYAYASAFILASVREPWGLVVNEAMASGLPVLVSDRCGCVDDLLLPGENGFLVSPVDRAAIGCAMLRMERETPEARAAMGQRSAEIIAAFSPVRFGRAAAELALNGRVSEPMVK